MGDAKNGLMVVSRVWLLGNSIFLPPSPFLPLSLSLSLALSGSWQLVGGANGKAPALAPCSPH